MNKFPITESNSYQHPENLSQVLTIEKKTLFSSPTTGKGNLSILNHTNLIHKKHAQCKSPSGTNYDNTQFPALFFLYILLTFERC